MSEHKVYSCDFCKKSNIDREKVIFEKVVVNGNKNIVWEDICESCFNKLTKFVNNFRIQS